jgi:hypothetical protein
MRGFSNQMAFVGIVATPDEPAPFEAPPLVVLTLRSLVLEKGRGPVAVYIETENYDGKRVNMRLATLSSEAGMSEKVRSPLMHGCPIGQESSAFFCCCCCCNHVRHDLQRVDLPFGLGFKGTFSIVPLSKSPEIGIVVHLIGFLTRASYDEGEEDGLEEEDDDVSDVDSEGKRGES